MMMKAPLTIIVDSREQQPYEFPTDRVATVRKALPAGDYSIEGFEQRVAVERKSMQDFVSTVIRQRQRFQRELVALASYERACVVVEGSYRDVIAGHYHSGAHPSSIIGAVASIIIDFGIPVYFCSDRQAACRFVEEYLSHYYRRFG